MEGNEKFFLPYMPKFYKVAFVSCAIKDNFIAKYPFLKNNASVVYNMFDSNDIVEKAKQKEELNIEQNKKIIVTVARIDNEIKQINWIPYICKELKQKCKTPFCWYVVGKGPDLNSNIELTKELEVDDVLKFVGERRNPFALENKADFTVLVSKSEAYPMTIIESFILKKPIVTTKFCAVHEMVVSEKNGLIVNQNIDDVVEGIIKFLNDSKGVYTKCVAFLKEYNHSNDIAYQQLMTAINM
jgi:glycosyltransferase involved in cell wall biosynthesis